MLRRPRPVLAAGLTALAVLAPVAAYAAPVTSRADAEALNVAVAGQGSGTGTVEATYDGEESVTGETTPAIPSGGFLQLGVLTQQATAANGFSAACAGVAGSGGGVIQIGDGSCLAPGDTVNGSLTDFDLGGIGLAPPEGFELPGLGELPDVPLPDDFDPETVLGPIQDAINEAGEQTGGALTARFDAIEGRCAVQDGEPSGSASLANAAVIGSIGGQTVTLADIPANPAPNTEVVTDLSAVVDLLLSAFVTNFETALNGELDPLGEQVLEPVREQLVAGIRDNLEEQLAPVEDNLLRITLNEQTRPTSDSIRVTALHAQVLPAAAEAIDAPLVDARVGDVGCGPADRVVADEQDDPQPAPAPPASKPRLPTAVSAGVAGEGDGQGGPGAAAYGILALGTAAAGAVGWSAWRRRSALHG